MMTRSDLPINERVTGQPSLSKGVSWDGIVRGIARWVGIALVLGGVAWLGVGCGINLQNGRWMVIPLMIPPLAILTGVYRSYRTNDNRMLTAARSRLIITLVMAVLGVFLTLIFVSSGRLEPYMPEMWWAGLLIYGGLGILSIGLRDS